MLCTGSPCTRPSACARRALILIKLFPSSLLLVSIFGLLDNIVRLAFGSVIGQFVDRWDASPEQHSTGKALLPTQSSSKGS